MILIFFFIFFIIVVLARAQFCHNYVLTGELVRCKCKAVLGSLVVCNGIQVLQMTNVRLVRYVPNFVSGRTFRFDIDPSYEPDAQALCIDSICVPKIVKLTEDRGEYYQLDIKVDPDSTTYRSAEQADAVLLDASPPKNIPNPNNQRKNFPNNKMQKRIGNKAAANNSKFSSARRNLSVIFDRMQCSSSDKSSRDSVSESNDADDEHSVSSFNMTPELKRQMNANQNIREAFQSDYEGTSHSGEPSRDACDKVNIDSADLFINQLITAAVSENRATVESVNSFEKLFLVTAAENSDQDGENDFDRHASDTVAENFAFLEGIQCVDQQPEAAGANIIDFPVPDLNIDFEFQAIDFDDYINLSNIDCNTLDK